MCIVVIVAQVMFGFSFIIYFFFQCTPIDYFWKQWPGDYAGHCVNLEIAIYTGGGINIFSDIIVILLPIPKLLKLQVCSSKRKIGIVVTFLVGLFVTNCSVIRLSTLVNFGSVQNTTYDYNAVSMWSALEGDVEIICACMPCLAGPIMHFFRNVLGMKMSTYAKSGALKSLNITGSRITGGKSITRLPSVSASEDDERSAGQATGDGNIRKTVTTTMYNLPYGQSSGDVELIDQKPGRSRSMLRPQPSGNC